MPFTIGPSIHNVVPRPLRDLIEAFFALADWSGLCLTGGTCLAEYYFGHRISIDMDLFTHDLRLYREAVRCLQDPASFKKGKMRMQRQTPHLAQFLYECAASADAVADAIKVDVMLDVPRRIAKPEKVGDVWVDSLDDLLANKLGCLLQRSEVKDFLDLFYLIPASHLSMRELVELGQKKDAGLDPLIMAQQIEFIFSAPRPEAVIQGRTDWTELILFFKKMQKDCWDILRPRE